MPVTHWSASLLGHHIRQSMRVTVSDRTVGRILRDADLQPHRQQMYLTSHDNLSMHDTDDVHQWLDDHPRWTLHFTPKHASWLNQIECAFSILQAKVLARGAFSSIEQLRDHLYDFMLWFNAQQAAPFRWSYRPKSWGSS